MESPIWMNVKSPNMAMNSVFVDISILSICGNVYFEWVGLLDLSHRTGMYMVFFRNKEGVNDLLKSTEVLLIQSSAYCNKSQPLRIESTFPRWNFQNHLPNSKLFFFKLKLSCFE